MRWSFKMVCTMTEQFWGFGFFFPAWNHLAHFFQVQTAKRMLSEVYSGWLVILVPCSAWVIWTETSSESITQFCKTLWWNDMNSFFTSSTALICIMKEIERCQKASCPLYVKESALQLCMLYFTIKVSDLFMVEISLLHQLQQCPYALLFFQIRFVGKRMEAVQPV